MLRWWRSAVNFSFFLCLALAVRGRAPGSHEPGSESGVCFARLAFLLVPALGSTDSAAGRTRLVRRLHSYYGGVRLLTLVHHRLRLLAFPMRTKQHAAPRCWSTARSPGSRTRSVCTCQGLRPRRIVQALAMSRPSVLPSTFGTVSASGMISLSRFNGWPMLSPADASPALAGHLRTARGRCGSLLLHREGLAPSTSCRFRQRTPKTFFSGLLETIAPEPKGLYRCTCPGRSCNYCSVHGINYDTHRGRSCGDQRRRSADG